jgi:AraC-like DNA-binding protein
MKAWTFTTETYALTERAAAWREAMYRLGLPVGDLVAGAGPRASVTCLASPLGMEFALIDAGAQTIGGRRTDLRATIWLVVLVEGRARIVGDGLDEEIAAGDVVYGPADHMATLALKTRCRLLWVRVPRMALGHRLIGAGRLAIGKMVTRQGLPGVLSGFLVAVGERLADLSHDDLRPIEAALTEFLAAILAELPGGETAKGATQISRVSQIVEAMLPEADLTLARLAEASGLAPRTLQKLLSAAGQTFAGYVRARRLERCRADLASPLSTGLSIAEISSRWGFSDPAYFSRAFRGAYGLSPREHRRVSIAENAAQS